MTLRGVMMSYVEFGMQSAFSFLRGASLPEDLVRAASEAGLDTLALTDRHGLYGSARMQRACTYAGLRALVGATVNIDFRSRRNTLHKPKSSPHDPIEQRACGHRRQPGRYPRVSAFAEVRLICINQQGYRNLCTLLTLGHAHSAKGESRISVDILARYKQGLLCIAGATLGGVPAAFHSRTLNERYKTRLEHRARVLRSIFSSENLVMEAWRHLRRGDVSGLMFDLAESMGIQCIATANVHFAYTRNKPLQDILTCIVQHTTLDNAGRSLFANAERYVHSAAQMRALFPDHPKAIQYTRPLSERCAFTLENIEYKFPEFSLPQGETSSGLLRRLSLKGAYERYGAPKKNPRAYTQINEELALIHKLELNGYFLIVWDISRYAKAQGIFAQGRGSAANSAVCYALGITAVDPVGMGLLFERFLSAERGEWPDIDIDLPSGEKRERVIQYVYRRYGPHGAAMTANVITYRDRSALRDTGKVLGFSSDIITKVTSFGGRWASLEEPGEKDEPLRERFTQAGLDVADRRVQLWGRLSRALLHLPRHLGQHSGGMVIAEGRLDHVVPIEPARMPGRSVIQWDKDDCAQLGIIKVDLLGLGMLNVLEQAVPLIAASEGKHIDYATLDYEDAEVYDMLCRADTVGVFQVESRAQMATLPRLKPRTFYDLVIEIALIRPGPISGQMVHPYLKRRAGEEAATYAHKDLEPILKRTLGVPVFQEQVMRIAMVIAGFSGGEAEELRRAMGFKRSTARMHNIDARLRQGMSARGVHKEQQDELVRYITSFAAYGFPESHSASFALLAYASAYLKCHHPAAFLVALLNAYPLGFYAPDTLIKDAQRHGVVVHAIDIERSYWNCTLEQGAKTTVPEVRLGLRFVKGLQKNRAVAALAERQGQAFCDLHDVERRSGFNRRELFVLAELGVFSCFGRSRRQALWQLARQSAGTGDLLSAVGHAEVKDAESIVVASPLPEMSFDERLRADYKNSDISVRPHAFTYRRQVLEQKNILSAAALKKCKHGARATTAGIAIARQRPRTAKGFFFITLEDETGFSNIIITPRYFAQYRHVVVSEPMLCVSGVVQSRDGVVHLRADRLSAVH